MHKHAGLLWIVGSFGWFAAADAQTAAPAAGTQYDGTYAFVSATKVNDTYTTRGSNRLGQCTDRKAGSLVIANGQARLRAFEGTVGSQGELSMRNAPSPARRSASPGIEVTINGRIDENGTVHAREVRLNCSYDLTWQKVSK